jgi:hypothetical protein
MANNDYIHFKALGFMLSAIPTALAAIMLYFAHAKESEQQKDFEDIRKYALAYDRCLDKETYLTNIYREVKDIDERELPADLMAFVIKVKMSQFVKVQ